MNRGEPSADLERFQRGQVNPAQFTHREHVRMAYEMLARYDFLDSAVRYTRGIQRLCERAGRPEKFHQTITLASLSLIAERLATRPAGDFESFAAANPDLLEPGALARWYRPQRLGSELARRTFLLPDPR